MQIAAAVHVYIVAMASSAGARTRSKVATAVKAFFDAAKSGNGVGVVGASSNRAKFGNKVLRAYIKVCVQQRCPATHSPLTRVSPSLQHGYTAHPVNPSGGTIEGLDVVTDVSGLPKDVKCLSIITPPKFAADVVKGAIAHGIEHLWFQPGAATRAIDIFLQQQQQHYHTC